MPQYRLLHNLLYIPEYSWHTLHIYAEPLILSFGSEIIATSLAVPLIGTVAIAIFLNLVVIILIITMSDHDT